MKKKKIIILVVSIIAIAVFINNINKKSGVETNSNSSAEECNIQASKFTEENAQEKIVIDVRTPGEYHAGHLKDAILINVYGEDFRNKIAQLDMEQNYLVYCKTGIRSRNAVSYMRRTGFKNVCDLSGGLVRMRGVALVK